MYTWIIFICVVYIYSLNFVNHLNSSNYICGKTNKIYMCPLCIRLPKSDFNFIQVTKLSP